MGKLYGIKSLLKNFGIVLASIFLLFTFIPVIFLLVIVPLLIVRLLAVQTGKLNPNLGRPLSVTSCHTAIDDIYGRPRCNLVTVFYLKDPLDVDRLLERVAKLLESDKYPELQQSLSRWICTYFWRKCPHFSIYNHVFFDPTMDPGEFRAKLESFVGKPFTKHQPLWEIIAFSNYKHVETSSNSALVIRIHHSLADAFALLNLVKSLADPNTSSIEEVEKRVSFSEKCSDHHTGACSAWTKLTFGLRLLFLTPVLTMVTALKGFDSNCWTIPEKSMTGTLIQFESYTDLGQELLKTTAKLQGKSISSIIFAGFTSAVRKTMMMRRDKDGKELTKPVTILYPWPRAGHSGRLTNHLTCLTIPAPIHIADSQQRLNSISDYFTSLQKSTLPTGMLLVNQAVGLISGFIQRDPIPFGHFGSAILSNFLYGSKPFQFFGSEATHFNILTGLQRRRVGVMCNAVNYNGRLVLGVKADSALFPNCESAQLFVRYMMDEFYLLSKCGQNIV